MSPGPGLGVGLGGGIEIGPIVFQQCRNGFGGVTVEGCPPDPGDGERQVLKVGVGVDVADGYGAVRVDHTDVASVTHGSLLAVEAKQRLCCQRLGQSHQSRTLYGSSGTPRKSSTHGRW